MVTIDLDQPQQPIAGWGASLAHWDANARAAYRTDAFRQAWLGLGLNILRVDMQKEVLTASPDDFATPVRLGPDLQENIARMDFTVPGVAVFGELAQWLKQHSDDPDEFRITGSLWTPPHWMKGPTGVEQNWVGRTAKHPTPFLSGMVRDPAHPKPIGDSVGGRLKTEDKDNLQQYGRYIAAWAKGFERAYGKPFFMLSLQNESTFENPFNSMTFVKNAQGQEDYGQYALGLAAVRDAWREYDLNSEILIMGPHVASVGDSPANPHRLWQQNQMIQGVKNAADPTLINFLNAYNANFYVGTNEGAVKAVAGWYAGADAVDPGATWGNDDYARPAGVAQDGKPIWFSETGGEKDGWPAALDVALKMHNALTFTQASAYVYWQLADGNDAISEHTLLGQSHLGNPLQSKKYAAFGQFSRFVRPGALRASANFAQGQSSLGGASRFDTRHALNVSAFYHPVTKQLTWVLINATDGTQPVTLAWPEDWTLTDIAAHRTDDDESLAPIDDFTVTGRQIGYVSGPRNITTFTAQRTDQ